MKIAIIATVNNTTTTTEPLQSESNTWNNILWGNPITHNRRKQRTVSVLRITQAF